MRRIIKNRGQVKNTRIVRQGDVLIERIDEIPEEAQLTRDESRIIIAYGETTGHSHVVESPGAKLFAIDRDTEIEEHYLALEQQADLVHDEHDTVTLPPGKYRVHRQFEHEPAGARRVID